MAIVTFPTAPTVGDTHNPGNGQVYTYREPGGVGVWVNESTGSSLVDNGDGTVTFNSGVTGEAAVVLDLPSLVSTHASGAELDTLLENAWDQQANASAAEIAALSGDETVLVELDDGTLRQVAFDDFPGGGGGVTTGPHANGSQTAYPVSLAEFAEINTPVTWTKPADATHVYISVFGRDQNESPSTISGIAIAAATGDLVATRSGTSFSVTVGGTTILTLNVASSVVSRPNNDTTISPILATYIGTGSVNTNDNWWVTNIQWLST